MINLRLCAGGSAYAGDIYATSFSFLSSTWKTSLNVTVHGVNKAGREPDVAACDKKDNNKKREKRTGRKNVRGIM